MTASMLDEVQVPPLKMFFTCPCCIFSFTELTKFIEHCEKVKVGIDVAIAKAKEQAAKPRKKAQP